MESTAPKSKSILVVDDDKMICDLYQTSLLRQGFRVVALPSGDKALEAIRAGHHFDLVVLDLMMPGRGGYDVLKELQQSGHENIPIFVVTARALDPSTFRMISLESNVQGILQKPVDMKSFHKKIHEVLGTTPPKFFDEWHG